MKAKDLRERSSEDLKELEKSLAKDTFTARFKNFTNRLDDTSTINKTKRDLARVKTLLRQAELNTATRGQAAAPEAKPAAAKSTKKTAAKKATKSEAK
jgi:large subunit ribosomal protein L29